MAPIRLTNALFGTFRVTSFRPAWRQMCYYHSHEYTPPPPFPPAETAILSAAISHVPHHGFTVDALKLGARDAGYLDVSTNLLPRGVFDLINYHLVTARLALKDTVQFPSEGKQGRTLGLGGKVRTLTLARLRANEPIISRWQEVIVVSEIQTQPTKLMYSRRSPSWPSPPTLPHRSPNWLD
jgi:ubiquinone biosynthesis protein COQ9